MYTVLEWRIPTILADVWVFSALVLNCGCLPCV